MMFPPSLDDAVRARAFRAPNGELGFVPSDTHAFLDACRRDGVGVLGWELWIIDHSWDSDANGPVPTPGAWCGGIPVKGESVPVAISSDGDADVAEQQLASMNLREEVMPDWLPYVRVNFTLEE